MVVIEKIKEFLPKLRLGIDIGEWAGGIAVVRGNEILHAETYTDYHNTTLEERRKRRRNRRTRHSKKMRLARLRSWVLRQKLPNGKRLPDPYELMRCKKFQCHPDEYQVKIGDKKPTLKSWIEAVKNGDKTDCESFVIALTHIFQKRGFVWGDLQEMTDKELSEKLDKIRLTPQVAEELKKEIQRRKFEPEENFKGEIKDFEKKLQDALQRQKSPRVAEHRSIVESELKQVIKTFTSNNCPQNTDKWSKELIHILNKPVRKARFENRIISGCSWCGKNTPRKSRVRELAYQAALKNLRVEEGKNRRLLSQKELKYFQDLWNNRKSGEKVGLETIRKHLLNLHSQPEMAKQIYELLYTNAPKGRTNICKQHLELQAQGAFLCSSHNAICKLEEDGKHKQVEHVKNVDATRRVAKNPCREAHDKRVINRIEEILFEKDGVLRFGDIPTLITIEFPKPHTAQTYECLHCREKLAIDLNMRYKIKNLKLDTKPSHDIYKFECPSCKQILQIKGQRQITIKGVKRNRPVTLKNSDAFLRKAKGGLKEKKKRLLLKETEEKCIYCGDPLDVNSMEKEHIFPESRGGPNIDINLVATCRKCNHPETGKGQRTPWEWKGQDSKWWERFKNRVQELPLPQRKKDLLLSKEDSFLDNPTALARAGARTRQFVQDLKNMLIRHGIPEEKIATNYKHNKLVIQTIDGWMVSRLRQSWLHKPDNSQNFPDKDDNNLHSHAQDAVLIAACPPHIWREQIFAFGKYKDRAPYELAPDWAEYRNRCNRPLVSVLGNYKLRWHKGFLNETFWKNPNKDKEEKKPFQYKMIADLEARQGKSIKDVRIREKFLELCNKYSIDCNKKGTKLPDKAIEELRKCFPGIRRVQIESQKSGKTILIHPSDGPCRKVDAYPPSEGVIVWLSPGKTIKTAKERDLKFSVIHPQPLEKFNVPRFEPEIPNDAVRLAEWHRYDYIYLSGKIKQQKSGKIKQQNAGWYRLKEFTDSDITVVPEHTIPKDMANRMGKEDSPEIVEYKLGKKDILNYFQEKNVRWCPGRLPIQKPPQKQTSKTV